MTIPILNWEHHSHTGDWWATINSRGERLHIFAVDTGHELWHHAWGQHSFGFLGWYQTVDEAKEFAREWIGDNDAST